MAGDTDLLQKNHLDQLRKNASVEYKNTLDAITKRQGELKSAASEAAEEVETKKFETELKSTQENRKHSSRALRGAEGTDMASVMKNYFDKFLQYMLDHLKAKHIVQQIEKEAEKFTAAEVKKHDFYKGQTTYTYDAKVETKPGETGELSFWALDKTKLSEMIPREGRTGKVADFFSNLIRNPAALVDANKKGLGAMQAWAKANELSLEMNKNGKFEATDTKTGAKLTTEELQRALGDKTKGLEATLSSNQFFGKDNFDKYDSSKPILKGFEPPSDAPAPAANP